MDFVSPTGTLSLVLACVFLTPTTTPEMKTRSARLSLILQQTRPLDPLTPEEAELATRIANGDSRVKLELGPARHQLIQVHSLAIKVDSVLQTSEHSDSLKPGRHAAVMFYRYDTDEGIYVVVDLTQQSVSEVTRLEGRAVPLAHEEVERAFSLALLNRQVRTLLGPDVNKFGIDPLSAADSPQNRVEGLRVIATSPRDPCYRHRCIELHFRKREGYVPRGSITVDLSAQKVKVQNTAR